MISCLPLRSNIRACALNPSDRHTSHSLCMKTMASYCVSRPRRRARTLFVAVCSFPTAGVGSLSFMRVRASNLRQGPCTASRLGRRCLEVERFRARREMTIAHVYLKLSFRVAFDLHQCSFFLDRRLSPSIWMSGAWCRVRSAESIASKSPSRAAGARCGRAGYRCHAAPDADGRDGSSMSAWQRPCWFGQGRT